MAYYVYMLASRKGGTIYTGVTNDLEGRVFDHREGRGSKFTSKYQVKRLVWYEEHSDVGMAIRREKNIKKYYRKWKIDLIEEMNPDWFDLYRTLNW
ncbi:MAG: GIY-YIG nuclease family protein [Pseudomonadota bacterium]